MFTLTQNTGLVVLSAIAVWDIRYRKMPLWSLLVLLLMTVLCRILQKDVPAVEAIAGAAVGIGFLGVSWITGEAFGYADSILILILGVFLGVWKLFVLLVTAFLLTFVYAAIGLMSGKFSRRVAFPFIPFLAVAYLAVMFL